MSEEPARGEGSSAAWAGEGEAAHLTPEYRGPWKLAV